MLRRLWLLAFLLSLLAWPLVSQAQKRTLLQEDSSYVNALNYGTTTDDVSISAAISALGSSKRVLFLPTATWTINQSVTVPSNITLYVPAGTTVSISGGVTLTLATTPLYDQPYWFAGAGNLRVTDKTWPIDVRVYGARGDGVTNDAAAITAALAAAATDGGTLQFTCGTYLVGSTITALDLRNIRLLGPAVSRGSSSSDLCAVLQYTASSGALLHFDGTIGVEIGSLSLTYSHASYADTLLRLDKSAGTTATTREVYLHDLVLQGTAASSKNSQRLIFLNLTSDVTLERVTFGNAQVGIQGTSTSASNVANVRIRDSRFLNTLSAAAISAGGFAWVVEGSRFEGLSNGVGSALTPTFAGVVGLTYIGNNHGGTSNANTRWVDAPAGGILGGYIGGNLFSDTHASSYCIRLLNSIGVAVVGNYLTCGTGISHGTDIAMTGNYNGSQIPIGFSGGGSFPAGQSFVQYPSFGTGTATGGTSMLAIGTTGGAGGRRVVCIDPTSMRMYQSSTGTDCSN